MSLLYNVQSIADLVERHPDCLRPLVDESIGRMLKRRFLLLTLQAILDQDTFLPLEDLGASGYKEYDVHDFSIDIAIQYFGKIFYDEAVIEFRLMRDLTGKTHDEIRKAIGKVDFNKIKADIDKELTRLQSDMLIEADQFMGIGELVIPNGIAPVLIPYYEKRSPHLWNVNVLLRELLRFVFSKSILSDSLNTYEEQMSKRRVSELFNRWQEVYLLYSYNRYLE